MRKIWKKCLALGMSAVMLLSMAGCGLLGMGTDSSVLPTFSVDAESLEELDLNQLYSTELGYSYLGVPYGITADEVGEKLGVEMGNARALGEYTCYYPQEAAKLLDGQVPITMEFVFGEDNLFRSVSYQFMAGGNGMNAESLDALFDDVLSELRGIYGDENEKLDSTDEAGDATLDSTTYNWKQDMGDGYFTSLQLVKGDYGYGTDIIILGVIRYTYEEAAEGSTEAEE